MASYRHVGLLTLIAGLLALALAVPGPVTAEEKKGGGVADPLTPAGSEVVAKINIRQILDSALFKKYGLAEVKKVMEKAEAKQFMQATGLDPLKDFDSVTITNVGTMPPKPLIIVRGRFDQDKIAQAAQAEANKDNKLKVLKEGGLTVYEITDPKQGNNMYTVVMNKGTLLMSNDKDNVVQAAKSRPGPLNAEMKSAVAKIDGKESFWLAAVVTDEVKRAMQNNPQAQQFADKLKAITVTLNVTDNAHLNVQIHTTDAKAANQIQAVVGGLKGLVEMIAQGNQDAGPVLSDIAKGITVGTTNTAVTIDVKVTEDQLKQLADKAKKNK